ncbi:unnamed protein product [Microthlaspi erraticum]|uniref:Uncharacterized protein n=1 Tax=Microthlaspi erraticum TaxID=1685480 RepID=A0A6D2KIY4_9BRAS|nr:unnamed protein product [Microthlaspi erraticum]
MIKKLTKGIEEATREKERLEGEKEKLMSVFKAIEQKAFAIQETYKETQKLIDEHKDLLAGAKSSFEKLKKSVDELKASRPSSSRSSSDEDETTTSCSAATVFCCSKRCEKTIPFGASSETVRQGSFKLNKEIVETLFMSNSTDPNIKQRGLSCDLPIQNQESKVLDPRKAQKIDTLLQLLASTTKDVCDRSG